MTDKFKVTLKSCVLKIKKKLVYPVKVYDKSLQISSLTQAQYPLKQNMRLLLQNRSLYNSTCIHDSKV